MRWSFGATVFVLAVAILCAEGAPGAIDAQVPLDFRIEGPQRGLVGAPLSWSAVPVSPATAGVRYFWNFGDGTKETGQRVTHAYAQAGTYIIDCTASAPANMPPLRVTNLRLLITTTADAALAMRLSVNMDGPDRAEAGETVTFTAQAAGEGGALPDDVSLTWDFSDGSDLQQGVTVSHVYARRGVYIVHLHARSAGYPWLFDGDHQPITITDDSVVVVRLASRGDVDPSATVTYPAGWNLVGGGEGQTFPGAVGPLYTLAEDGSDYEAISPTQGIVAGRAYWAYFAEPTTIALFGPGETEVEVLVARGQFAMVGNTSPASSVSFEGTDVVYAWDPVTLQYNGTESLTRGQGGWVFATAGVPGR